MSGMGKEAKLMEYLRAAEGWGECRFVIQGRGAILECLGKMEDLRTSVNPKTGGLITLSSEPDIPGFECHLHVDEVHCITSSIIEKFDKKKLRVARFLGEDNVNLLSVILNVDEDGDDDDNGDRIEAWEASNGQFGGTYSLL
jgi:hypothetical protein